MNHIAYSLKKMIMANTNVAMRIDETLESQLQELMSNLWLDMTTFFTMAAKIFREIYMAFYENQIFVKTI